MTEEDIKKNELKLKNKVTNVFERTNTKFLIHNLEKRILLLSLQGKS